MEEKALELLSAYCPIKMRDEKSDGMTHVI